jgi:hypothetical protein
MLRFLIGSVCFFLGAVGFANPLVFDFETGELGAEGWRIVEGVNTKPVGSWERERNNPANNYGKHGKFYLTTLETAERRAVLFLLAEKKFLTKANIGFGGE